MKYIIALVAIAIVVGIIALQTMTTPSDDLTDMTSGSDEFAANESLDTSSEDDGRFSGTDTLESLVSLGVPVECEITHADVESDTSVSGTFFVADERMRGDFIQEAPGIDEPVLASMIIVDEMMYSWSEIEGEQYGIKMDLSAAAEADESMDQAPVATDELVEYDCREWKNVDNSVFEPPSDVRFQDMSALLEAGMEYGTVYEGGEF